MAWLIAHETGGAIVLRIEDLDRERSKQEYIDQVMRDYEFLGLTWDDGPYFQADRNGAYTQALEALQARCKTYPCFCSRADLKAAASAPHLGEKWVYTGTCRNLTHDEQLLKAQDKQPSLRVQVPPEVISFTDAIQGSFTQNLALECGDFLVQRADGLFAYQLAVVVDDAAQGITSVVRGYDLITSTPQQMFLQDQLGYHHPSYAHVPLFVNEQGKRLSKRDKDAALPQMLERYGTAEGIIGHIAFAGKLIDREEPVSPQELLQDFHLQAYSERIRNNVGCLEPIVYS